MDAKQLQPTPAIPDAAADGAGEALFAPESVARQLSNTATGEMVAFTTALGAAYISELVFPKQVRRFEQKLANSMGAWSGKAPSEHFATAKNITDFVLLNLGGIVGTGVQFGLRSKQKPDEQPLQWGYEAARLAVGRVVGSATAFAVLMFASKQTPAFYEGGQKFVARQTARLVGRSPESARVRSFADLAMNNAVQTVGAIAGNVPAQLLFDKLVARPASKTQR